jgi:hypothetical protein
METREINKARRLTVRSLHDSSSNILALRANEPTSFHPFWAACASDLRGRLRGGLGNLTKKKKITASGFFENLKKNGGNRILSKMCLTVRWRSSSVCCAAWKASWRVF